VAFGLGLFEALGERFAVALGLEQFVDPGGQGVVGLLESGKGVGTRGLGAIWLDEIDLDGRGVVGDYGIVLGVL